MNEHQQILTTKLGLIIGSVTGTLTLADIDLIMAILLKFVSIISFIIVIALNIPKLYHKIKNWRNGKNN